MANEILLPHPKLKSKVSIEETIFKRRSNRNFTNQELTIDQLSQLLWSAQGETKDRLRSTPSAGALYPIEIFFIKKDGLFRYFPDGHKIVLLSTNDLRYPLAQAALSQNSIAQAPLNIIISAIPKRTTYKYGQRGIRYVYIEVGHIAQNVQLEAEALGLGSVPIGAFDDEAVKNVLSLPNDYEPLYILPVGHIK